MRIAIEEHWASPLNEQIRQKLTTKFNPPSYADPELIKNQYMVRMGEEAFDTYRIPEMRSAGIDMQILSFGSPGLQGVWDPAESVKFAIEVNDKQKSITEKYPGRFEGFAALPTADPKAAAAELRRAVTQLGCKGALVNGHTFGKYLDAPEFWGLWETAEELGAPIYLHPYDPMFDQMKIYDDYVEMNGPTCAWNIEMCTHATRLVVSGVFDAFPKASLIIGHMGEMLPYQLGRIDEGFRSSGGAKKNRIKNPPSYYITNNILITTSGYWRPETMRCAIDAMGADRILFGGDYPFMLADEAVRLIEEAGLDNDTKDKIYYKNAQRVFGLV